MNPGELNTKITIQEYQITTDGEGFQTQKWTDFKKIWAKKTGLSGRIFYAAAAVQSEQDVIFMIRYCKDIKENMRIVEGDNIYDIKAIVDKTGKRREMYITASKVTPK